MTIPRNRCVLVDGAWTTDVVFESNVESNLELLIVPGNPGTQHFYIPFAEAIANRLRNQFSVRIVTLAGFAPECVLLNASLGAKSSYTLEDQVQFMRSYLTLLRDERQAAGFTPRRFMILAHSIGSHISSQVLARHPELGIEHCVLIFPFIRFDLPLLMHAGMRTLLALRHLIYALVKIVSFLPERVKTSLLRLFTDMRSEHILLASSRVFLDPAVAWNFAMLGLDEFRTLPRPGPGYIEHVRDPEAAAAARKQPTLTRSSASTAGDERVAAGTKASASQIVSMPIPFQPFPGMPATGPGSLRRGYLSAVAPRLTIVYNSNNDTWAPLAQYEALRRLLPSARFVVDGECRHGFPAYPVEYARVAAICCTEVLAVCERMGLAEVVRGLRSDSAVREIAAERWSTLNVKTPEVSPAPAADPVMPTLSRL